MIVILMSLYLITDLFLSIWNSGNVFVIAAILLERHLHSVANYLIVSLAVADLLVACLVMPLAAVNEVIFHSTFTSFLSFFFYFKVLELLA